MGGRETERGSDKGGCRETSKIERLEEDGRASERAGCRERSMATERETGEREIDGDRERERLARLISWRERQRSKRICRRASKEKKRA